MPQPRWTTDEQLEFLATHVESFIQHHTQGRQDEFYTALFQAFLTKWPINKRPSDTKLRELLKAKAKTDNRNKTKHRQRELKKLNKDTENQPKEVSDGHERTEEEQDYGDGKNGVMDGEDEIEPEVLSAVSDEVAISLAIKSQRERLKSWFRRQLHPRKDAMKAEERPLYPLNSSKVDKVPRKRQSLWVYNDLYWEESGAKSEYDRLVAEGVANGATKKLIQGGIRSSVLKQFYDQATPEIEAHVEAVRIQEYDEATKKAELAKEALKKTFENANIEDRTLLMQAFIAASNEFAVTWSQILGWDVTIFSAGPNSAMDGKLAIHLFGGKKTKEQNGFRKATMNFRERVLDPYKQYLGFLFQSYINCNRKDGTVDGVDDNSKWEIEVGLTAEENGPDGGESTPTASDDDSPADSFHTEKEPCQSAQSVQIPGEDETERNGNDNESVSNMDRDLIVSPTTSCVVLPDSHPILFAEKNAPSVPGYPIGPPIQQTDPVPVVMAEHEQRENPPCEKVPVDVTNSILSIGHGGTENSLIPHNDESSSTSYPLAPPVISPEDATSNNFPCDRDEAEATRGDITNGRGRKRGRGKGTAQGRKRADIEHPGVVVNDDTMPQTGADPRRSTRKRAFLKEVPSLVVEQPAKKAKIKPSWHYEKIGEDQ